MRFRWAYVTLCASQLWGCGNPQPNLADVEPKQAYRDSDVRLTLLGSQFLPATILDPDLGRRIAVVDGFHARIGKDGTWAELTELAWQSPEQMTASFLSDSAALLPPGYLDVEIADPRGQTAALPNAFYELGPDITPPTIVFTSPSPKTPVGPETILRGSFHASDAPPGILSGLGWNYLEAGVASASANCLVILQAADLDCAFQITVSSALHGGEEIQIVAEASDASVAHNRSLATLSFTVHAKPFIQSIAPASGGTSGGTDVVLTGSGFLSGSQALVDGVLLFPEGGIVIDEHTLSGHVPAHEEGTFAVTMQTPIGDASGTVDFTYLSPPQIKNIAPAYGTPAGGTPVTITGENFSPKTQIYFGSTLDSAVLLSELFLQSNSVIVGYTPMGNGQTTVWAFDETLGYTALPNQFTWRTP
jgi:hypothetical protein